VTLTYINLFRDQGQWKVEPKATQFSKFIVSKYSINLTRVSQGQRPEANRIGWGLKEHIDEKIMNIRIKLGTILVLSCFRRAIKASL
jgi:hypothetical protein